MLKATGVDVSAEGEENPDRPIGVKAAKKQKRSPTKEPTALEKSSSHMASTVARIERYLAAAQEQRRIDSQHRQSLEERKFEMEQFKLKCETAREFYGPGSDAKDEERASVRQLMRSRFRKSLEEEANRVGSSMNDCAEPMAAQSSESTRGAAASALISMHNPETVFVRTPAPRDTGAGTSREDVSHPGKLYGV